MCISNGNEIAIHGFAFNNWIFYLRLDWNTGMDSRLSRRQTLRSLGAGLAGASLFSGVNRPSSAAKDDPKVEQAIEKGLRWVAKAQSSLGHWTAGGYPTAMTALAGTALVGSGSTTIQGPYAKNIRKAVDYLL